MAIQKDSSADLAAVAERTLPRFVSRKRCAVPVLLLGGDLTGVGASRILARARIGSYWIGNDSGPFRFSRFTHPAPNLSAGIGPAGLCDFLERCNISRAVLLPCSDDWLLAVAALPKHLRDRFPSSLPSLEVADTFVDKWKFAQAVKRLGIPHPHTTLASGIEQLRNIADNEVQSCLLKPLHSLEFSRKHGVKAYLASNKASALSTAEALDFPILLQEYIPGPADSHFFLDGFIDARGRPCALFARQRLRMYPEKLSNSTLMVSIPLDIVQPAVDSLLSLLRCLNHRGIFSAEFKYDARDNLFKILEVNARAWWYVEFTARCGMDVCAMAYNDALGLEIEPVTNYHIGRRCVNLSRDLAGFLHRSEGFPNSFWSWSKSVIGAYDAIFRWSDPVPAVVSGLYEIQRRWHRRYP